MESATEEFFSNVILSSAETQKLFPNNILVFDSDAVCMSLSDRICSYKERES